MSIVWVGLMQSSMAQIRVFSVFNSIGSGRSINLLASRQIKNRHEFGGGLRININKHAHNDDQQNVFKKRMYATKPLHYFGIEGFYHIHLLQKLQHIDFFSFYDIQLVYSTTGNRCEAYMPEMEHYGPFTWIEQNIGIGFTVDIWKNFFLTQRLGGGVRFIHFGPFTWLEQNIGIGFTIDIWKNFFLTQRLGGGVHFILGEDKPFSENKHDYLIKAPFEWEFGYVLSVGIGYRFEPKKQ